MATLDQRRLARCVLMARIQLSCRGGLLTACAIERLALSFQQFYLNTRDTVLNNVMLPLVIAGIKPSNRRERATDALATVELSDKLKSKANDLSGGQKQRVCIARGNC